MKPTRQPASDQATKTLKSWFQAYTAPFLTGEIDNDRNIRLKQAHTHRVCRESLLLADGLGLVEARDRYLAEVTALLHDVGRFEQYRRFQTFVDGPDSDHAIIGHAVLEEEGCLGCLPPEDQALIKRVVLYHNRATLPEDETEACLFFTRLLRDADKLDIWRVVTSYYAEAEKSRNKTLELGLPDTPGISDAVYHSLMNQRLVLKKDLQNLNDFKLLQVGWVFDLNFAPSLARLAEKGYLELIRGALPIEKRMDAVFKCVEEYMAERRKE